MRASLPRDQSRSGCRSCDAALDAVLKELAELRFAGFDDQMLVFDLKLNNRMAALQNYVAQVTTRRPNSRILGVPGALGGHRIRRSRASRYSSHRCEQIR